MKEGMSCASRKSISFLVCRPLREGYPQGSAWKRVRALFPPTNNGLGWGMGQWPSSLSVGHPRPARRGLFSECDLAVVGGNVARRSHQV